MNSKEETLNKLYLEANTKPCPFCGIIIEKDKGCMSVKCRKCQKEFCWLCLKSHNNHQDKCEAWEKQADQREAEHAPYKELLAAKTEYFASRFLAHKMAIRFTEKRQAKIKSQIERV